MNETPSVLRPVVGHLTGFGLLRITGPDSISFLQGQLSNDTRRLGDFQPLRASLSTPQGRVLAILHLIAHSTGTLALLPREITQTTLEHLRKYVLRAKVRLEDASANFDLLGRFDANGERHSQSDGVCIAAVPGDAARQWIISEASAAVRLAPSTAAIDPAWRLADIRAGLPQVYTATRELFVAQMLNLDLIDGISFTKGCFTGQEIIARTQHLGRIKRRMFRLQLPAGAWAVGQPIVLADGRSGRLIDLASVEGVYEALAVLGIEAGVSAEVTAPAEPHGPVAAMELPLPYPLTPTGG